MALAAATAAALLSGGQAHAACGDNAIGGTPVACTIADSSLGSITATLTYLSGAPAGTTGVLKSTGLSSPDLQFTIDTAFSPILLNTFTRIKYKLELEPGFYWDRFQGSIFGIGGLPKTLDKDIYSDAAYNNRIGALSVALADSSSEVSAITPLGGQYTTIYIEDFIVNALNAPGVSSIANTFRAAKFPAASKRVPAPLPILGAAAAFASFRKARHLASLLRPAS